MNVTDDLLQIVTHAHSLPRILEASSRAIAERLQVETCFVFLVDETGQLVRSATDASHASEASQPGEAEALSVANEATSERRAATVRGRTMSFLGVPMLLRDGLVGALVVQSGAMHDFSAKDIGTLAAISGQLVGIIENAHIIDALYRGERPTPLAAPRPHAGSLVRGRLPGGDGERVLGGIGASPGVAIGPVVFRGAYRRDLSAETLPAAEPDAERARVRTAMAKAHNDILRLQLAASREIDEEHALIFASHLLLLNDPVLLAGIDQDIERGVSAPMAIDSALGEFEARLRLVPDAYIQERIDDVDDLRSRLLDHVLDAGTRPRLGADIVVTDRIAPSLVIEMKTDGAQALVAERGGTASHGVLLARAMGIPVVTGVADMLPSVRPGERVIVDGTSGAVVVRPSDESVTAYEAERLRVEHARTEHAKFRSILARTSDGVRVPLHANVGVASELTIARENGAEGIGLYRTEFPFIVRGAFPTRAEQVKIYSKAYAQFPNGTINFRILDLAGDKFVAGSSVAASRNAFHGYRSIRVLFDHPEVLRDQVQALAIAASDRPLRILIPMVTSIEELRRVKGMIDQALASLDEPCAQRQPEIGVMIEVPAAVELAGDIANEADFLSIGTNDLMQYALVVDREDSRMALMSDPYHPAILRMISRVVVAARAAETPVSVCGELAARPDGALALMALGIDSLSVVPTAIPELKHALASARLEPMQRAMPGILALSDARSVASALRQAQAT